MGRPYGGKPSVSLKWVRGHPYVYERLERPIRRLSPSEMASRAIVESLIPQDGTEDAFYYAKKVGPYGYLVEVVEKYVRPASIFEAQNPSVLKKILGGQL